jgi:hypothetical protein
MAEKHCPKCGEIADEAKAFCPGCGNAFVEEKKRETVSEFDQSKRTVQLGATMFNQMLSDMGLNISKKPADEKNTQVVTPLAPAAPSIPKREAQPSAPVKDSKSKIIMIAIIAFAVVAFVMLVVLAAVAALIVYYR